MLINIYLTDGKEYHNFGMEYSPQELKQLVLSQMKISETDTQTTKETLDNFENCIKFLENNPDARVRRIQGSE